MDLLRESPPIGFKTIHWLSKEEFSWSPFETRWAGGTGWGAQSAAGLTRCEWIFDEERPQGALKVMSKILKSALYFTDSQQSEARIGEIRSCYLQFVGHLAVEFRMSFRLRPYDKVQDIMSGKNQVKMIWRRGRSLKGQPGRESFWPWIIKRENRMK